MRKPQCDREAEVLEALAAGRSLPSFGDELRGHAAGCAACAEVIGVAGALLDDRASLMSAAPVPSAGLVWWRAAIRARQEAARAAMRTARLVQIALLLAGLAAAVALVGGPVLARDLGTLISAVPSDFIGIGLPLIAFVAWLILAPVALYFVVTEE